MKIPCKFQDRKTGSCATVRMSLGRHPDAPQCLEASVLKTSRRQSNTVQTLGQASPISTRSWISVLDNVWEVSASCPDDVATRPDAVQHFKILWTSVRTRKGVIAKTVRTLGQAIRTYTCYGKICAILEGGHRRPSGRSIARVRF
jgi:hypothetical protein